MSAPVPPSDDEASATVPQTDPPAQESAPPAVGSSARPSSPRSVTEVFADHLDEDGFFSALFDVTFTKFVTRRLAGPVYVVGLTLIGLAVLLGLVESLAAAIATESFWGVFLFLLDLLLVVVGSMLAVLLLRVGIEVFVAVVAIAENTRPRQKRSETLPPESDPTDPPTSSAR